ncbi:hypothetical protein AB1Y20_022805 [Prymnesium parvum]|uniref:Uncharacterized protein n=1 Tax=Prymnesium parvum TaxID=97485 RepID=A0AB34JCA9_PRYPA|mmetsp:Transcript_23806/g.59099  ORF Transcript_23806/g.59099 Transcript_23806/m.59099 type:complete len:111 (-) Transcript_23806:241-573(-)
MEWWRIKQSARWPTGPQANVAECMHDPSHGHQAGSGSGTAINSTSSNSILRPGKGLGLAEGSTCRNALTKRASSNSTTGRPRTDAMSVGVPMTGNALLKVEVRISKLVLE